MKRKYDDFYEKTNFCVCVCVCLIPDQCSAVSILMFPCAEIYSLRFGYEMFATGIQAIFTCKILFRNLKDSIKLFSALVSASGHFQEKGWGRMAA